MTNLVFGIFTKYRFSFSCKLKSGKSGGDFDGNTIEGGNGFDPVNL